MPQVRISGYFSEYVEYILDLSEEELREWGLEGGDVGYDRAERALREGKGYEVERSPAEPSVEDVEWWLVVDPEKE